MAAVMQYDDNTVSFILNGKIETVSTVPGDTSLNTYIRDYARLKGTKLMCKEGGCGACVVSIQFTHPSTGRDCTVSVNSCMFPLYACHGLKVTTVEGVGSKKHGYHDVQTRLAHFYGTQCGYCTPGWVMAMFSFLESNPKATMEQIEDSFAGNLCRCTGYRPILDAFKSFASNRSKDLEQKVVDIEDLLKVCPRNRLTCNGKCHEDGEKKAPHDCVVSTSNEINSIEDYVFPTKLKVNLSGAHWWYKVDHVDEIFQIFEMLSGSYMLVGGNTAQGILKDQPPPDVYIDINSVGFLKSHSLSSNHLYIGANTTLSETIDLFKSVAAEAPACFSYLTELAKHIGKVANIHVRNVGTIAGNLFIKHQWRSFQSDLFLILETVGARLSVRGENDAIDMLSLPEFLETNMYKRVILQIVLPPLDSNSYVVKTYKIAPRAQNAVAYVNAGFRFKVNKQERFRAYECPTIVFGGIRTDFIHATHTELYMSGRRLLDTSTLHGALNTLHKEIVPDNRLPDASPEYRRGLAKALLYRALLSLNPKTVIGKYRSGADDISRPLSSGRQEFDMDSSQPPLYQPFPKQDSLLQCSGEAEYVADIPPVGNDLYAALVISKQGPSELEHLDPSKALKIRGVIAFFSASDIPGQNTFTPSHDFIPDKEELFASKDILHAGQPVGMIVAETQELADSAAELVDITYKNCRTPVLNVKHVVKNNDKSRIFLREERKATHPGGSVKRVIKGEFQMDTQYHLTMETLSCVCVPVEDGLDVFCTSQWLQSVQETIALLLNIPEHSINMKVRRLGGGYGVKLTRANIVGGACSLAAHLLQRPVRLTVKLETMMEAIGKRWPCYFDYEAGVDEEGVIQYVDTNLYSDAGSSFNDFVIAFAVIAFTNVYDGSKWSTHMYDVKTDKASTVWTRAPGTLEAITMSEQILEHIAFEMGLDPLEVRMKNLDQQYPLESMIKNLKEKSEYDTRKTATEEFNKNNVWKKRGLSVALMRFPMDLLSNYHAMISVYRNDGTVALTHGGVEVGQGINTKAAQVCASLLGIPLDFVVVKPTNNFTSPNDGLTGGSFTTDSVCFAVEQCCLELNKRLEPIRKANKDSTWSALIQAAYADQISLNVSYMFSPKTDIKSYQIFGAVVLEAEVDILTGEHKVVRVDVLEDAGKSLNPYIDIGQVEGALVMGLGYFTSEQILHDPETGRVLTNRTLKYKVPGAKDIPTDFRVYLLKNSDNPLGVLRSKAIGEPPICLSVSVLFAIRQALRAARQDLGLPDTWLPIDAPFTAENIFLSSKVSSEKYVL